MCSQIEQGCNEGYLSSKNKDLNKISEEKSLTNTQSTVSLANNFLHGTHKYSKFKTNGKTCI